MQVSKPVYMFSIPFGYFGSLRSKVTQKLFDSLRASKVCPLKLRFIPPTFAGPRGIEHYMFSIPFGYFGSLRSKVTQKLFDSLRVSKVCPLKLRFIPPTFAGPRGIELYEFSTPFGQIGSLCSQSCRKSFSIPRGPPKINKTKSFRFGFCILRAHEESNLGQRFWKPAFYR